MFGMQIIVISNNVIKKTSLETNFSETAVLLMNSNSCNLNIILNFLLRFIRVSQTHMLQHALVKHIGYQNEKFTNFYAKNATPCSRTNKCSRWPFHCWDISKFYNTTQLYLIKFELSALFFLYFWTIFK